MPILDETVPRFYMRIVMGTTDERKKKPVVGVVDSRYRPTKAEMEEEIVIDASQEELLRSVVQDVELRIVDPKGKREDNAGNNMGKG